MRTSATPLAAHALNERLHATLFLSAAFVPQLNHIGEAEMLLVIQKLLLDLRKLRAFPDQGYRPPKGSRPGKPPNLPRKHHAP